MKTLHIISVIILSVVLLVQIARHGYQLVFGMERSVIEQYAGDYEAQQKARKTKDMSALIEEYRVVSTKTRELEREKTHSEIRDMRSQNKELYNGYNALQSEIRERESKSRQIRDILVFSTFGIIFIAIGVLIYKKGVVWPGFGLIIAGFCELEYWASPSFFRGGALGEYTMLLWVKLILSVISLSLLYALWSLRGHKNAQYCSR